MGAYAYDVDNTLRQQTLRPVVLVAITELNALDVESLKRLLDNVIDVYEFGVKHYSKELVHMRVPTCFF